MSLFLFLLFLFDLFRRFVSALRNIMDQVFQSLLLGMTPDLGCSPRFDDLLYFDPLAAI